MNGSRVFCMLAILFSVSYMHTLYSSYSQKVLEEFEAENAYIDKEKLLNNVRILRDSVIKSKGELMMLLMELETLIQRTVVLETSGFLAAKDSVGTEPNCEDVKQFDDFELSNDQIDIMYKNYVMYVRNIKQFKSNMFITLAGIRAKVNILEPDLSYEDIGVEDESMAPVSVNEASMEKHDQRLNTMLEIDQMLEELRDSLASFYTDFRNMSKVARQMRCVNNHMLELVHGKDKKEDFVLYKLASV